MYAPVPGSEDDADRQPSPREWRSRSSYGSTAGSVLCCTCEMPQFEMTPERRNMLVSYLSGLLFATAWWLLIDANVLSHQHAGQTGESGFNGVILWWFYIPGVISTIALIMINLISPEVFSGQGFLDDSALIKARIFMFVAFILAFAGLLGSGWILFGLYVVPDRAGSLPKEQWPGVALVIQNLLIFISSGGGSALVMRFGRTAP